MSNITVILPLVDVSDENKELIKKSVDSIDKGVKTIFIGPKECMDYVSNEFKGDNFSFITNNKNTDIASQITKAVKSVDTDYFSVLEFDDTYSPIWFKNVEKYIASGNDSSIFIPLVEVSDFEKPELGPIGYLNEPVWAASFSKEIGYLDEECLKDFFNFNVTGSVINTKDFKDIGGIKTNIKIFMWYELLLRMCYNSKKVFVLPKAGYNHTLNRKGSMSSNMIKEYTNDEYNFWFETAKKEYVYKTDRVNEYQPKEEEKTNNNK